MKDPQLIMGFKVASKIKDHLSESDMRDFAKFYYKEAQKEGKFGILNRFFMAFIELMIGAKIYPFPELNQEMDALQLTGLVNLVTNDITTWLFENGSPKPKVINLLKYLGFEAWLYKPANRVMYILPEKMDMNKILDQIESLEEVDLVDKSQASSDINDWEKL